MYICASYPVTQLFCWDHHKQFSCLSCAQAKQKNNFFMIHSFCCSSSLVTKLCLFPLILFSWPSIALWLTSTLHKSPVQMSQDVYYKGLDLKQVRKVWPLALMVCVRVSVCVVRPLTQGAGVCLQFAGAAHHRGSLFPGEQCSYSH